MTTRFQTASAMIFTEIACAAKKMAVKSSKMTLLVAVGLTFVLSSCSRNMSSGCGTWSYKQSNERKYNSQVAKMYRTCPSGFCSR
ncbi:MAG: hypothetical protein U0T77_01960 [Chitinophagales bacterium]